MFNNIISLFFERKDFFIDLFFKHIYLSYITVFLASIIGILIAIIIENYPKFSRITISLINFLYTIPSIAMFGFLIPIFGIGNKTAIIALIIYALLPIVLNTFTGIKNIDENLLHAALAMGSNKFQILYKIKLPLATPFIFSGIKSSLTMSIALTGIASFIGAGGLGVGIYRGITTNNTDLTIISSALIAILAVISEFILFFIEKIFFSKKRKSKKRTLTLFSIIIIILSFIYINNLKSIKENTINIATKPMTEQYILGEMLKILIEDASDLKVNLINGVGGGTSNIHIGMLNKKFDIYPEYTGTSWMQVLKKETRYEDKFFYEMNKIYEKEFSMKYINMYGFNNTYGIAIRKELAEKYNINNYSDLAKYSNDLIFGAEYDFYEREDGYEKFAKTYNLNFKSVKDMDISLKYKALSQKEIDVMVIFTTDALLNNDNIKVLNDDLNFYPSYKAGNIVRLDLIKKYPILLEILEKTENILDDKTMSRLNYLVEEEKIEAYAVAKQFLLERNLIK